MSKPPTRKPHIHTPPERTPPRRPPEPPQKHIPKPIKPEPHQSGGQTHRGGENLPFSTMQDFLQYEDLSCNKTFIKFFCRGCDKPPAFLLYICTEYKPGTPGRTPGNSQGRTGKDHRTGQPERRPERTPTATDTNAGNNRTGTPIAADMGKFPRHGERGGEQRPTLPCALLGRPMPGEYIHPCLLMGRSTAGGLSSRPKHGLCKVWVCG